MRVKVPRAMSVTATQQLELRQLHMSSSTVINRRKYVCAVQLPGQIQEIEVPSYFYETHGRRINDCVHSKVVTEGEYKIPLLGIPNQDSFYTGQVTGYSGFVWESDPFTPGASVVRKKTQPSHRIINDGALSIYVEIPSSTGFPSANPTLMSAVVRVYYAWMTSSGPRVYSVNKSLSWRTKWSYADPDPVTKRALITGEFISVPAPVVKIGDYTVPDSVREQVGTLISGFVGTGMPRNSTRESLLIEYSQLAERAFSILVREARNWIRYGIDTSFKKGWSTSSFTGISPVIPNLGDSKQWFLLGEREIIVEGLPQYLITRHGLPNYWRNVLVQRSYLDALEHVPTLNDNSISNIIEIAGFIKSLVIDHKIEIPKSLSSAWLSYRYVYTTTKLDAEEAISFVHRSISLGTLNKWITCYGEASIDYSVDELTTTVKGRCCLQIKPRDVGYLSKVWRALYTYGLQPNFYVVWDSIPFSFIVDWLIPIGSVAHAVDASSMYSGTYYDIRDVCFSLSYDVIDSTHNVHHQYSRWRQSGVPELNGFYFLEADPATDKVKGMRILDSLSLFIGKG